MIIINGNLVAVRIIHNHKVKRNLIYRLMRKALKKCQAEDLWNTKITIEEKLDYFVPSNLVDIKRKEDWDKVFLAVRDKRKTISLMTTKKPSKTNNLVGVFVFSKSKNKKDKTKEIIFAKVITSFFGDNGNKDEFEIGTTPTVDQTAYWLKHALSMYGENLTKIYDGDPRRFIKALKEGASKEDLVKLLGNRKKKSWVYQNKKEINKTTPN